MHISLDGFVAGPNGEMDRIKVDEEIFDHVGKRISGGDTVPIAGCSLSLPTAIGTGEVLQYKCIYKVGVDKNAANPIHPHLIFYNARPSGPRPDLVGRDIKQSHFREA